jgi:hypothetical protein
MSTVCSITSWQDVIPRLILGKLLTDQNLNSRFYVAGGGPSYFISTFILNKSITQSHQQSAMTQEKTDVVRLENLSVKSTPEI